MIKKHIIKEEGKPVAVVLDYNEYVELKAMAEDKPDYYTAIETKRKNKKWVSHDDLKNEFGMK
ncbi:MAG TPA: hypothetical protein PK514_07990 [Spirochaetota bacterium]|nr:hypothetical protein [Spirochaetota bacterium]